MSAPAPEETTILLRRAAAGSVDARNEVWTRLYDEVLLVARAQRSRWSGNWTLETRALAHEVFLKLFGRTPPEPSDRKHFFTILSRAVRHILVNYSEAARAAKRGGDARRVTLNEEVGVGIGPDVSAQILDLHDALRRFEELDTRAAKVVELRFFTGLTYDEIAETLDVSRATAVRDWETAKAWLNVSLSDADGVGRGVEGEPAGD